MKQVRDKNKNAFLQSYDQFYAEAQKAIFNSFPDSHRHCLSETILDSLTESQINQYNSIELQTFELNKEIKSKLSRFGQSEVSAMMIRIRNVVQELQRMCSSLKIKFIFELFQKLSTCLIMMTSLHFVKNKKQQSKNQDILDANQDQQKQIRKKSHHGRDGKRMSLNQEEQCNRFLTSKKSLKSQKMRFGGISLYNENYKRNIENKHYISRLNQSLGERAIFWKQLQNNCKETLGTTLESMENKKQKICNRRVKIGRQNKIVQQQKQSEMSEVTFLNLPNDKTVEFRSERKVEDQSTFAQNAENILNNYEQLCFELNLFDFSDDGMQKIIEDVSGLYRKQKKITLDSLKKVVTRFWYLHQQKSQKLIEMIKRQVEINKIMEYKLMNRLQNMKQVGVQTIPYIALQKKNEECERLKSELNILEKVKKGLQQVIIKQHMNMALLQKANVDNIKKLEFKQKVCRQYEEKLCKQINNKQNKADNKAEIQSKCWPFYHIDSCRKDTIEKDSLQFTQHQHQMHDNKIQHQIITNMNISGGFSFQGIPSKFNKNQGRHINFNIDQSKSGEESHSDYSGTRLNSKNDPVLQTMTIDICQYRNDLARNSNRKKIMKDHINNRKKQLQKENQILSQKIQEKALALSKMDLNNTFLRDHLNSKQNKLKLCSIVCSINLQSELPIGKYRSLKYPSNLRKCSLTSQKSLLSKKKKQLTWRHTSRNNIEMSQKTIRYEKSHQKQKEYTTASQSLNLSKILDSNKQKALSSLEKSHGNLPENKYNIDRSIFQKMRLQSHQSQKYISYVSQLKQKYQNKQLITNQLCQRQFSDQDEDENQVAGSANLGFFHVVQAQLPKNQLLTYRYRKADEIKISHQSQSFAMKQSCNDNNLNKIKSANSQSNLKESSKGQRIKKICNSKLNKVVHYTKPYFLQLQQTMREQTDMQDEETRKIEVSQNNEGQWYKQHRKELRVTVPNNRLYNLSTGKIRVVRKQYRKPCNRRIMNAKKVMLSFDNSQTED